MNRTKIEWTCWSWNPITGCKHGCWYCYARKLSQRFPKIFPNGFEPTFHPERLKEPWKLKKPSKIFVCSISDLFAPWTPVAWRNAVLESIRNCPIKHTFQLLTKSPEGIPTDYVFQENIWVGVTVTNPSEVQSILTRLLNNANAKTRFVSFEPLLGPCEASMNDGFWRGIQWIIIGKLTGSRRIKLQPWWIDHLIDAADWFKVPIFMKNNLKPEYPGPLRQEFPR